MILTLISYHLAIGLGVYLSAAARNFDSLKDAIDKKEWKGLTLGALGIPGWPIALAVIYTKRKEK